MTNLEYYKKWRAKNRDKTRLASIKWNQKNKKKLIKKHKEYYQQNKEKVKARTKEWRKNNPEKVKEYTNKFKDYYERYKERINKYYREYTKRPDVKFKNKARNLSKKIRIPKGQLCMRCNKKLAVEKHHPNYNKPFRVRFLCRTCHKIEDILVRGDL